MAPTVVEGRIPRRANEVMLGARNLERATADLGPVTLRQRPGRIVLDLDDNPQPEAVVERARRVCGVASVSLGYRTSSTLSAMPCAWSFVRSENSGTRRIRSRLESIAIRSCLSVVAAARPRRPLKHHGQQALGL